MLSLNTILLRPAPIAGERDMENTVPPATQRPSIDALTSLRGIAALLVVVHHMGLLMLQPLRSTVAAMPLEKCGLLGMSVFFVLSGFVIHYNYADRLASDRESGVMKFLFARLARLYPLYLPIILINYAVNVGRAVHSGRQLAASAYSASLPAYLAGMQSWFYATLNGFNLSISQEYANNSWSISAELFLYLFFIPLALYGGFKRHSTARGVAIAVAAIFGRILFVKFSELDAVRTALENALGAVPSLDVGSWLVYYSPYGRLFEFLAGVGIAEIWLARNNQTESPQARALARVIGAIACAYIAGSFADQVLFDYPKLFGGNRIYSGYAVAVPAAIYLICRSQRWLGKLASWWPLLGAGEISYSLYMLHGNLFPLFLVKPHDTLAALVPEMIAKSIAFLIILFAASWLTYRYWEMPCRKRIVSFYRKSISPRPIRECDIAHP
ncbi:acyltransferase family protein [Trinickia diaoshuihuensis]|uniref:acyltransferase family protein n=1 Tax=Trinickia diaoshuihuensis TaxID=2292265 RepID=UPI0013C2D228|nr:acyltransferase [Trinickia diaoshuihuensis]